MNTLPEKGKLSPLILLISPSPVIRHHGLVISGRVVQVNMNVDCICAFGITTDTQVINKLFKELVLFSANVA